MLFLILLILVTKLVFSYSILLNNNNHMFKKVCNNCKRCSNGFTGSGVLLYEKNIYDKKTFILGFNYKYELTDFGGKINNANEKVYITALRECNEETKGTINLTLNDIITSDYIDISRYEHKYRSYIVKTNFFDTNKFNSKKIYLNNNNTDYNEILKIIKINEDKLKKIFKEMNSNNMSKTTQYSLSTRLIKILKKYYLSK